MTIRWRAVSVAVVAVATAALGAVATSPARAANLTPARAGVVRSVEHGGLVRIAHGGAHFGMANSSNWSGYNVGYLDRGSLFTSITADWVVPQATQRKAGEAEYSATWIGIGGGCIDTSCSSTDSTLIQLGTEQDVDASGNATYSDWWEVIPGPSVTVNGVQPGDHVHAVLGQVAPGLWKFSLVDYTHSAGFSGSVPYWSDETTAEWINETPLLVGSNAGVAALPNLSPVVFSRATLNGRNPALAPAEAVQLGGGGTGLPVLATPSAPAPSRDAFRDCAYTAACHW